MLMRKNVNNDVSKDTGIGTRDRRFMFLRNRFCSRIKGKTPKLLCNYVSCLPANGGIASSLTIS